MSSKLRVSQGAEVAEVALSGLSGGGWSGPPISPIRFSTLARSGTKRSVRPVPAGHPRQMRFRWCLPYARVQLGGQCGRRRVALTYEGDFAQQAWYTASTLRFGGSTWNGGAIWGSWLYFGDVRLPTGAAITRAHLRFRTDDNNTGECHLRIRGVIDSPEYVDTAAEFDGLTRTSAYVDWDTPIASGGWLETPDLAAIVEELLAMPGWQPGMGMGFVVEDNGSPIERYSDREVRGWQADFSGPRFYAWWDDDGCERQMHSVESWADARPSVINFSSTGNVECRSVDGHDVHWSSGASDYPGQFPTDWNWIDCRRGTTFEPGPPAPPWWEEQTAYDTTERVNVARLDTDEGDYPPVRQDAQWNAETETWSNAGHYFKVQLDPLKDIYRLWIIVTGEGNPDVANRHGLYVWNAVSGQWDLIESETYHEAWFNPHLGYYDYTVTQPYVDDNGQVRFCFFEDGGEGAGSHLNRARLTASWPDEYYWVRWGTIDREHAYWLESYWDDIENQYRTYLVKRSREEREAWRVWQQPYPRDEWGGVRFEAGRGDCLYYVRRRSEYDEIGKISKADGTVMESQRYFEDDDGWQYYGWPAPGPGGGAYFMRRKFLADDEQQYQVVDYHGSAILDLLSTKERWLAVDNIAVDADGNVWASGIASQEENDELRDSVIWKNGEAVWSIYNAHAMNQVQRYMLAIDKEGFVYGLSYDGHSVKLTPDGDEVWRNRIDVGGTRASGFSVDRFGHTYHGGRGALSSYYSPWRCFPDGTRMHDMGPPAIRVLADPLPPVAAELEGLD